MARSTIEEAYAAARMGKAPNLASLKLYLKANGCRAVDALLAPRNLSQHLEAICAATYRAPKDEAVSLADRSTQPDGKAIRTPVEA